MRTLSCFLRDRRGSSIVTVLIGMLLIAALGATLLFTSYTGYRIKVTEHYSTQNFYDAETALNEIRAGVQHAVTASISTAYAQVLTDYNSAGGDAEQAFETNFLNALFEWVTEDAAPLFPTAATYDPAVFTGFLNVSETANISLDGCLRAVATDTGAGTVTLLGVTVRYTRDGYETNVTTDISIAIPHFSYTVAEYTLTGVPEFALIATTALNQSAGGAGVGLRLSGSAYAGEVNLTGANNTLSVTGGNLICGSDINVSGTAVNGSSRLILDPTASAWAERMVINAGSSASLAGDVYLSDDLDLAGDKARAALSGRFYGFGYFSNETLAAGSRSQISQRSSSIVINGRECELDMSGLGTLFLAGHSFINSGSAPFAGQDVLMGQSVSVKSDQLAYLIPELCLSIKANPYIYDVTDGLDYTVNFDTVLWGEGENARTLRYYVPDVNHIQTVTTPTGAQNMSITYFFMRFDTKELANAYFRDYFAANPERVQQYLQLYASVLETARAVQTSGATYNLDKKDTAALTDDELDLIRGGGEAGALGVSAQRMSTMYQNYRVTLTSSIPAAGAGADNPFDYVVDIDEVNSLPAGATYFTAGEGGEPVAVIVRNAGGAAFTVDTALMARYPHLCLIIATGGVNVDRDFEGLILSDGVITMSRSVEASPEYVADAMRATTPIDGEGIPISDFLNSGTETGGGDKPAVEGSWELDSLVTFENWKKH